MFLLNPIFIFHQIKHFMDTLPLCAWGALRVFIVSRDLFALKALDDFDTFWSLSPWYAFYYPIPVEFEEIFAVLK